MISKSILCRLGLLLLFPKITKPVLAHHARFKFQHLAFALIPKDLKVFSGRFIYKLTGWLR